MHMYQEILNGMGVNVTPSALRQVPGGAILMDPRMKPNDLDSLFDAFCHHFRNVRPWVWTGEGVTPFPGPILDGLSHRGQCMALARAFRALAIQSAPYGLGMSGQLVEINQFNGPNGVGFVSRHGDNHQLGTVLSLQANVFPAPIPEGTFTPVSAADNPTNLYLWGNHKTVAFMGLYYDALYGKIWDKTSDMVLYGLNQPELVRTEIHPVTGRAVVTRYIPATDSVGLTCYFRFLTDVEVNAIGRSGYQGPFSTLPGKASEGLMEGNVRLQTGQYLAKVKRANA